MQLHHTLSLSALAIAGRTSSIVQLLFSEGPSSQADIASRLQYSHQLTAQRLRWLAKQGIVKAVPDPHDGRRQVTHLTRAGVVEAEKLQHFLAHLNRAYLELFEELGSDVMAAVISASVALEQRSIDERMAQINALIDRGESR